LDGQLQIPHYNWFDRVKEINLSKIKCTPELLNSGVVSKVFYEPWMDVEKYPNTTFIVTDKVDPRTQKVEVDADSDDDEWEEIMAQLVECHNLDTLIVDIRERPNYLEWIERINCRVLCTQGGEISSIVEMNKHECIFGYGHCTREAVENNYTLIGGSFYVENMWMQGSEEFLEPIFERNRRPVKSAKKI
jgi:hypothetical protein